MAILRRHSQPRSLLATVAVAISAMLIGADLSAPSAQAAYIVTLGEQGTSVVATGSGPIDLTGLSFSTPVGGNPFINPLVAGIATGMSAPADLYVGFSFTGPASFGPGFPDGSGPPGLTAANSGSGDIVGNSVGITTGDRPVEFLVVPSGYVSNNPLSDTATYLNQSFASLGVTPGTYEWTWGTGANQNFTLQIGPATAVPEPPSLLLGIALVALLIVPMSRRIIFETE
jgi:hypothetical protein